jgi:hypothetical protein
VFIEHPLENSMASFDFTSVVLDEGTTFIFSSWIRVANSSGGFNSHLTKTSKPEITAATRCSDPDEFINNLDKMLLPNVVGRSRRCSFLMRLQLVLHRTSWIRLNPICGAVLDSRSGYTMPPRSTRRLCGSSPSPTWRRT